MNFVSGFFSVRLTRVACGGYCHRLAAMSPHATKLTRVHRLSLTGSYGPEKLSLPGVIKKAPQRQLVHCS